MISAFEDKYCCDNPTLIEGRDEALNDRSECWKLVHRNQFTQVGILTPQSLRSMGLFWQRHADELIYMPRSMYRDIVSLHRSRVPKTCNIVVWRFWHMLNPNKLLCECSPEEYHHLATLSITLRNRIKSLQWQTENNPYYPFKIYRPWVEDHNAFILWALQHGFNDPSTQGITRVDKSKDFTPDNLEVIANER